MKKLIKILLVDDDELFNYIHLEILKKLKLAEKVEIAVNGKEALNFFKGENKESFPEIVLLDIDMPIMNGFEFLHELSTNYEDAFNKTQIIMLTSSISQRDIDKAKEYKVSGYLNKPLNVDTFQETLKKFL